MTIALAAAVTAATLPAMPATAATVPVTFDSSTPTTIVTGLKKGEVVDFTATLTSTDPNESGEGEPLDLTSSGGFSATVSSYSLPYSGSFTAQSDGETLSGSLPGADGDESATVQVTLDPSSNSKASDKVKNSAAGLSDSLAVTAGVLTIAGGITIELPPVAAALAVVGGVSAIAAVKANQIARDPADPHYTVIARPEFHDVPTLPAGLTGSERYALGELSKNLLAQSAVAQAAVTSYNRAAGATQAGRSFWAKVQYAAAIGYVHRLGWLLSAQPGLQVNVVRAMKAAKVPDVSISPTQALAQESNISANGLPSSEVKLLKKLGASADDIQVLTQLEITMDVNQFSGPTLYAMLTSSTALNALRAEAKTLMTAK